MNDAEHEIRLWMNEVNMRNKVNEVAPEVSTVNKVNEESTEIKEEMSKGKSLEVKSDVNAEAKVEVSGAVIGSCVVKGKPPEVPQRFDFADKVQMEEFGMKEVKNFEDEEVEKRLPLLKEVMQIDDLKMKEESRHASWDPGERVDAKAQTEMFNVKVEVMPSGDVNVKAAFDA